MYKRPKQNYPKKKQEGKVAICGGFMNIRRMKKSEKQGREGKVHSIKCRISKIAKREKKPSSMKKCFIKEENNKGERLEIFSGNLETSREISAQRLAK